MTEAQPVLLERRGHVAALTLNRPESRNALSVAMMRQLREILQELRDDASVWLVTLTGAGGKAFCAGADLKERRTMPEQQVPEVLALIRGLMDDIAALPQPSLAILNGHAFGGGCEMALACDLRVLASEAMMGLTETSLGIIPGAGGCVRLPRLLGLAKAKELILLAKRLSAAEALQVGLVHEVCQGTEIDALGQAYIDALLRNGPLALRAAKRAMEGSWDLPAADALRFETECYMQIIPTQDRLEALAAFAEKRAPVFKGC
ncbi:MAG: enoyl-CoA hydratase/isomerase family protein [Planctomycetes bacterium]|nr:enoyl-CoA hydratase/isomerase family protein [Planctomycetota bacterium]